MDVRTQQPRAAVPAYTNTAPAEHARDGAANQTLRARRRTSHSHLAKTQATQATQATQTTLSVDTSTTGTRAKKRSANYIRTQAASPEVISSLIDQLSAISASTQQHFEKLPIGYEDSAAVHLARSSRTSVAGSHGTAGDRSPYYSAIRDQNDLYPDDACEPPVVRTSKPPSGLSPMTALPKQRKEKTHSLASYMGRSGGSSASIHSCHSARSSASFGNISVEATTPASKPVAAGGDGSNRSSLESKRSVKRPRSLLYMSSRERLKQKEVDSRRRFDDTAAPDSPRKPAAQLFAYEDTIKEEPLSREEHESFVIAESSTAALRHTGRSASPARRIRLNLVDGPIEHALVPDRASSLRHSSPSKKTKRDGASRSSAKGKEIERPKTIAGSLPGTERPQIIAGTLLEETERPETIADTLTETERPKTIAGPLSEPPQPNMDPDEVQKQQLLMELEQEEDEVAQRIKQLREQKLLRDKMAGKLPANSAVEAVPKPHVPALSSPESSSASIASCPPLERAQDCAKAHKLLGISTPSAARSPMARSLTESVLNKPLPDIEHRPPTQPTRPAPLPPYMRHSRPRSLTVSDGDDLTLPINYALALQSLDMSAPNSPLSPRVDSTRMFSPPPSGIGASSTSANRDTLKRSSSLSVGGRSAFGRRANGMMMKAPKGHKHSTSLTEEKPPTIRSASEEVSGRHSSLSMTSVSNSFSLQQKRTLKKKRWSHPDLPARAEKAHNDKIDAEAAAMQNSYSPVIEERPTSLDSVDIEVDSYLNSQRLSQKIRHPQTGRIISFSEVGDPNGYAVFVCVGMGLTRFVMAFYDQLAATLKLRLITPERPGVGASQVDPNGTPLTWPGKYERPNLEALHTDCHQMTYSLYVKR